MRRTRSATREGSWKDIGFLMCTRPKTKAWKGNTFLHNGQANIIKMHTDISMSISPILKQERTEKTMLDQNNHLEFITPAPRLEITKTNKKVWGRPWFIRGWTEIFFYQRVNNHLNKTMPLGMEVKHQKIDWSRQEQKVDFSITLRSHSQLSSLVPNHEGWQAFNMQGVHPSSHVHTK